MATYRLTISVLRNSMLRITMVLN